MSQDTEVDLKEVELNELEPEKQPINAPSGAAMAPVVAGGAEKNGLVKIKVADDEAEAAAAAKFTGLSKEELLKVAGSPGWVRTRWALLVLFWLGWLGMLAGAVVIIVQAPRCRQLPAQSWWHKGALYRIGDLQAFQGPEGGDLAGELRARPVKPGVLIPSPPRSRPAPSSLSWRKAALTPSWRGVGVPDSASSLPLWLRKPGADVSQVMCRASYISSPGSCDRSSPPTPH